MPILFERPTYEWVARVNQKHKQLDELRLSAEQTQKLDRWIKIEFVYATLRLEGLDIPRDLVARIASSQGGDGDSTEAESANALFQSLRALTLIARERGNDAALSAELLLRLNDPTSAQGVRDGHSVPEMTGEHSRLILDSACQWFEADSFQELHPIEQASIVFLRLIDLRPFIDRTERTAVLAASLFTLRSGLPPIIIDPKTQPAYRAALAEGLQMNTKRMVEFIAESVERKLEELILRANG